MTSRAHRPAEAELPEVLASEPSSAEPSSTGSAAPNNVSERVRVQRSDSELASRGSNPAQTDPAQTGPAQTDPAQTGPAESGELAGSEHVEGSLADDGEDAEEVSPDSAPELAAALEPDPEPRLPAIEGSVPKLASPELQGGEASLGPPTTSAADAQRASAPPLPVSRELAPPMPPQAGVVGSDAGSELTASEMAALGASEVQPLAERQRAGGLPKEPSAPAARTPPWVDEVPDPVTPYEQRVSETIKVADLPPVEQLRGRVLANRYLAEELAEHTATSLSYRAYHLALDRAVTVRVLPRGLACTDEACREVRRVASLASAAGSSHIADLLDFGVLSDGWPFTVTEHFPGRSLAALVAAEGKFVLRRVLHIGKQLAEALSSAHEAGLTHGLLNPDNVLIVEPGSPAEVVKVLGFGVSQARGSVPGPPRSGVFGVPFYVSPEQASCRPLDARSDIYSLGVILYELMTGSPPFSDGDFAGVLCQHLDDEAPPPSSRLQSPGALAKAMDAVIERCLRKDAEQRYPSAAALREDLLRLEVAAARTKRRPMPEVQRPPTTIHTPHPKAEGTQAPGAKVIVHGEGDEPLTPRAGAVMPAPAPSSQERGVSPPPPAVTRPSSPPQTSVARAAVSRAPRVRVDQATVRISATDRELILGQRPQGTGLVAEGGLSCLVKQCLSKALSWAGWLRERGARLLGGLRRFISTAQRGDDAGDP